VSDFIGVLNEAGSPSVVNAGKIRNFKDLSTLFKPKCKVRLKQSMTPSRLMQSSDQNRRCRLTPFRLDDLTARANQNLMVEEIRGAIAPRCASTAMEI
jgi:hypothetical protein